MAKHHIRIKAYLNLKEKNNQASKSWDSNQWKLKLEDHSKIWKISPRTSKWVLSLAESWTIKFLNIVKRDQQKMKHPRKSTLLFKWELEVLISMMIWKGILLVLWIKVLPYQKAFSMTSSINQAQIWNPKTSKHHILALAMEHLDSKTKNKETQPTSSTKMTKTSLPKWCWAKTQIRQKRKKRMSVSRKTETQFPS